PTPMLYTLSLHDALPIYPRLAAARRLLAVELQSKDSGPTSYRHHSTIGFRGFAQLQWRYTPFALTAPTLDEAEAERVRIFSVRVDRKSTRLNSSHLVISY